MSSEQNSLGRMPLFTIARLCEQETARFWQKRPHDPRYCYALWQRAIVDIALNETEEASSQSEAWAFLYRVYARQVRLWVKGHRYFPELGMSDVDLADLVWEKMWVSFARDKEKFDRFPQEPKRGVPALLDYLKTCVRSVLIDELKRSSNDKPLDEVDNEVSMKLPSLEEIRSFEESYQMKEKEDRFWACTVRRLKDDKEKIVIAAMFIEGLPPRKIALAYPQQFKSAQEVSRIKNRVMRRLKKDLSFADCVGEL